MLTEHAVHIHVPYDVLSVGIRQVKKINNSSSGDQRYLHGFNNLGRSVMHIFLLINQLNYHFCTFLKT